MQSSRAVLALFCGLLSMASPLRAAIDQNTYPFTALSGIALQDMSASTRLLVAANIDNGISALTPIGFEFWFEGAPYSRFSVNANGVLRLGTTPINGAFDNFTDFASAANNPKIAPYYDNLRVGANGRVHYKVIGSAPARRLVVEWNNMQIPRGVIDQPGAGTFQALLSERTGAIDFVYGAGIAANTPNGGYTVGIASAASNFASVTTATDTVSYSAANNINTAAIASGEAWRFAPPIPAAPTALSFTAISPVGMTLNWADTAGEALYLIERSTDGIVFRTEVVLPANSINHTFADLRESTTYQWRVYAVSSGAFSAPLSGAQATSAAGAIVSTAVGGNWNAPATWVGGVVPGIGDRVTIVDGATVTLDAAAAAYSLDVGSGGATAKGIGLGGFILFADNPLASLKPILTAVASVRIALRSEMRRNASAPPLPSPAAVLQVGGDLTVDGTLAFGADSQIVFSGPEGGTFSGSGVVDIALIKVKDAPNATRQFGPFINFRVLGVTANAPAFLVLESGQVVFGSDFGGDFSGSSTLFVTPTIPAAAGFELANPNYNVLGQTGGLFVNGTLLLRSGAFGVGVGAADRLDAGHGARIVIVGGRMNLSGAFAPAGAIHYQQTGGSVNAALFGNSLSNIASFDLRHAASTYEVSGGEVSLFGANASATSPVDYRRLVPNISRGGLLQVGPSSALGTFRFPGGIVGNVHVFSQSTLVVNNANLHFEGSRMRNDGTIASSGASAELSFAGQEPMRYFGAGNLGTVLAPFGGSGVSFLGRTTLFADVHTFRANALNGLVVSGGHLILGAGSSPFTVQVGGDPSQPAGRFFDPPVFSPAGEYNVLYAQASEQILGGHEIRLSRSIDRLTVGNSSGMVLSGGNVTLTNSAVAANISGGFIATGENTLVLSSPTGTVNCCPACYVDGSLQKSFAAVGNKSFEVGAAGGISFVDIELTGGVFPTQVTVAARSGPGPGATPVAGTIARHFKLTSAVDPLPAARLLFRYQSFDLPPGMDENSLTFLRFDGVGGVTSLGGTVDSGANSATLTGVTQFSDWGLGVASVAVANGALDVATAALGFGSVEAGEWSTSQAVTLSGSGDVATYIRAIDVPAPFLRHGGTCPQAPFSLAGTQSCTAQFRFAPVAKGAVQVTAMIDSNDPGGPFSILLTGNGAASAPSLDRDVLEFGTVNVGSLSAPQSIEVSNDGVVPLVLGSITAGGSAFVITAGSCAGATLQPGQDCVFSVRFAPQGGGEAADVIGIASDGVGSPTQVLVHGVGFDDIVFRNGFEGG